MKKKHLMLYPFIVLLVMLTSCSAYNTWRLGNNADELEKEYRRFSKIIDNDGALQRIKDDKTLNSYLNYFEKRFHPFNKKLLATMTYLYHYDDGDQIPYLNKHKIFAIVETSEREYSEYWEHVKNVVGKLDSTKIKRTTYIRFNKLDRIMGDYVLRISEENGSRAGLFSGVWHGVIFPCKWVGSWFAKRWYVYSPVNNGLSYLFGYLCGLFASFIVLMTIVGAGSNEQTSGKNID